MKTNSTSPPGAGRPAPAWATYLIDVLALALALGIITWAALTPLRRIVVAGDPGVPAALTMAPCVMNEPGYLRGRLHGSLAATIDWRGPQMTCDGMTRPNDQGIRLIFALPVSGERKSDGPESDDPESGDPELENRARLIFLIGIDGDLQKLVDNEEKANVTIVDEGSGRFFSAGGQDRCWTTINLVEPLAPESGGAFRVDGELYCLGALPSLNGKGSVTLSDFRYSGRMALDDS